MFGKRTRLSFCQLLALQQRDDLELLLEKYGIHYSSSVQYQPAQTLQYVRDNVGSADDNEIWPLLREIVALRNSYRFKVSPRYLWDERWADFTSCLMLDGYSVDHDAVRPADPTIEAFTPIEDDLTAAINECGLPSTGEILRLLNSSADHFRATPPDYNASLTAARISLETIAREIAVQRCETHAGEFDPTKWGAVVAYLRRSGFISAREEQGLAGVYSFISEGAHVPVGMTEQEMVRLGRNLAASMSYFLLKQLSLP